MTVTPMTAITATPTSVDITSNGTGVGGISGGTGVNLSREHGSRELSENLLRTTQRVIATADHICTSMYVDNHISFNYPMNSSQWHYYLYRLIIFLVSEH